MRLLTSFLAIAACCLASNSYAYCVYNASDSEAHFGSFGKGTNFSKTLPPGGKACCPYSTKSCNFGKSKTSLVQMATRVETSSTNLGLGTLTKGFRCGSEMAQGSAQFTEGAGLGYHMEGGGYATLNGKVADGSLRVDIYNANDSHRGTAACAKY